MSENSLYEHIGRLYIANLLNTNKSDYTDMEKYSRNGAYHHDLYVNNINNYRNKVSEILQYITKYITKEDSIIEIGCGDRLYVKLLKDLGYNIYGIDVNQLAVKLAKSKGLEEVSLCDVIDYNKEHDVCLMIDSFEHFTQPIATVNKLNSLIKKKIILLNPNWRNDKHHFAFYTKQDLETVFGLKWNLKESYLIDKEEKRTKDLIIFERKQQC